MNCETLYGTCYRENAYNVGVKTDLCSTCTREIINFCFFEENSKMVLTIYDDTITADCESDINDSEVMNEEISRETTFRILHDSVKIAKII